MGRQARVHINNTRPGAINWPASKQLHGGVQRNPRDTDLVEWNDSIFHQIYYTSARAFWPCIELWQLNLVEIYAFRNIKLVLSTISVSPENFINRRSDSALFGGTKTILLLDRIFFLKIRLLCSNLYICLLGQNKKINLNWPLQDQRLSFH